MLILDVGKIKYNKKFYKSLIYTTLILNIISFGIFPKSQSKFKEESKEPVVVYSAALYTEKKWTEEHTTDTIDVTHMKLIDDEYKYSSTMKHAYFEYSITSSEYTLHYDEINESIEFSWETTNPVDNQLHSEGTCDVIKYQKSEDEKGILLCRTLQNDNEYFGKYGITLKISAKDQNIQLDYNDYKKTIIDLTIEGEKVIKAGDYQTFVGDKQKSDPKKLILDSPNTQNGCEAFNEWLRYYSVDYYPALANKTHESLTGIVKNDLEFTYHDSVKAYLAKYMDSSSCSLLNLDIPGLKYETVEISVENPNTILQRYIYSVEDNFLGYARTYTNGLNANPKEMYFNTKDGTSFGEENDLEKWQKIFVEYIQLLYPQEATELIQYITNRGGILSLLQQTTLDTTVGNYSNIPGFKYYLSSNKVIIDLSVLDDIYNENHKGENKLRITKLNTEDVAADKVNMWNGFKRNVLVMYNAIYSMETLESLYKTSADNINRAKMLEISKAIRNAEVEESYVDGIQGLGTDAGKTFTVHVYSDENYKWFEILPEGTRVDENTTMYTIRPESSSVYTNDRMDSILKQIQMLDAYYKVDKHTEINEDIVYLYNANKECIGYIQIALTYDSNYVVKEVNYTAYIGEFDEEVIKPSIKDTTGIDKIETPSIDEENLKLEESNGVSADLDLIEKDEKGEEPADVKEEDNDTIKEVVSKEEIDEIVEDEEIIDNDSVSLDKDVPLKNESDTLSENDLINENQSTQDVDVTPSQESGVQDLGNEEVSNTINDSIESVNEVQTEILLEDMQ